MPASAIKVRRTRRLAVARWRFPARTLHLVDIENLAGAAIPSLVQVMDVQDRYARSLAVGVDDQVVMAASHLGLVNAAVGWPHARYRVRSGPNGADLELLDVIWHEDVATRFNHVVIGSGDGTFVSAAQALSDGGIWVTVVSRWGSLSPRLAHAARDVVYLDTPPQAALFSGGMVRIPQGRGGRVTGEYDAVVVGSGPNGLIGALMLAEAGQRVLLLEGAPEFGGGLRSEALTLDGFTHDVCATVLPMVRASAAFRDLGLPVEWADPEVQAAHPLDGQDAVLVHRDVAQTAAGLGSRRDAIAWRETVGATARGDFRLVDSLLSPLSLPRAPLPLARYGALGLLPATTLARSAFRGERARAVLAGMSAHAMLDLRAPVTGGYGLLLAGLAHQVGWPLVRGGSQALANALVARIRSVGGEAVTGHYVRSIADLPPVRTVLLDLTPRQVLAVCGDRLPGRYARRLAAYRYGPGAFKLDWALSGPVPWKDPQVGRAATVHLGGTLAEVAAGEAAVAAGRHPERPYVLVVQPCVADPSRAPDGRHVLWAYCHVPNGSTVDMTSAIEGQIERFAPGFRDLILARHAMDTVAYEKHNPNLIGGDIGGGSAALAQFLRRPRYSPHPWQTPLPGVYLCSASTPPGAAVHGMGGYHAAKLALARLR